MGRIDWGIGLGKNICSISENEDVIIYKMQDATGEGMMTCFHVLPGIDLIYNDFHMRHCSLQRKSIVEMISIEYCREGCIEWELENGKYLYLQEGDLQVVTKHQDNYKYEFPLNHYYGVTVAVYIEEATKMLANVIGGIPVDLVELKQKFCYDNKPFVIRSLDSAKHIFYELFHEPDKINIPYLKIKALESLFFLSQVPKTDCGEEHHYFSKVQVEIIKDIMKLLTENLERHYTLNELSNKFDISLTTMKNCFKGIYGTSVFSFMRTYRMQTASYMLRRTNQSIAAIAANVGYSNPSKFSAAFKDVVGTSPLNYRKSLSNWSGFCLFGAEEEGVFGRIVMTMCRRAFFDGQIVSQS